MAIIKCKMCGGDIELAADKTFGTCEFCGSTMTLPKVDDDQRAAAFNRGNHFRRIGEFDKALAVYERIVREDDTDAEAHWCCALCRFGIEYVEDPATYEYLPTCHRASFDSFLEDVDYLAAVEYSDGITRRQYQKDAAKIAEVQRGILATSQNEEPFDVFICYKESDENGERTRDSLMAQDVYYQLTDQGYRVFFARITLEDMVGKKYEPYIFAALNSAKVMIAIGTKPEYMNAVWVKNEWSRFLAMMKKDRHKILLPCYKDMDPYDMPEQLSVLQSYDMAKIGFVQDLIRGIKKVLDAEKKPEQAKETVVVQQAVATPTAPLLQRAFMFLEDGDWNSADTYCEKVLDIDPKNAQAYLGKLMAELKVKTQDNLKEQKEPFDSRNNYQKAIRFADAKLKQELEAIHKTIVDRIAAEEARIAAEEARIAAEKAAEEARLAEAKIRLAPIRKKIAAATRMICTGNHHVVSIKIDGTAVAVGRNNFGQCGVGAWQDIIAVSAGNAHTVGLKANGTVVAVGDNNYGQCDVGAWQDIIAISVGHAHTVGLKANGTVVAFGSNRYNQCNVSEWQNIIAISAGGFHTVGLKADGTMVAVGNNSCGQCNVSDCRDVVAVSAGREHTIGLKADGTVVEVGKHVYGCNVSDWRDIVAVSAGGGYTVGLKADGTVVAVGCNNFGQCDVSTWRDVVAVSADEEYAVGLKVNGTVVAVGAGSSRYDISCWKLFDDYNNIAKEQEIARIRSERRAAYLCQHCGGQFKGFFAVKCRTCGREKDY